MSGVGKSAAGNTILGREEFRSETSASSLTLISEGRQEDVCGREVLIVDTPGLCNTDISEEKLEEEMKRALTLCKPGPDAFLLVMQLGRFTQQEKRVVETLQELIYKRVNEHTMVLFTYGDRLKKKTIEEFISTDTKLQQLLEKCGNRYHVFNNEDMDNRSQVSELLQKIGNMVATEMKTLDEGGRKYPINRAGTERIPTPHRLPTGSAEEASVLLPLKLVLVGMSGVGKSAAGNTILGREEFRSETSASSLTLISEGRQEDVCGREVLIVDTPGLCNTDISEEKLEEEMKRALTLCKPGPDAFLLVIQLGRFTQQEKRVVETLQELIYKRVNEHTMVLFTYGDRLKKKTIEEFISTDTKLQQLLEKCGNRYHVFNNEDMDNRSQVSELLQKIGNMVATEMKTLDEGGRKYPINRTGTERIPTPHRLPTGSAEEASVLLPLKLVLVGMSGVGKSAAGNTILGREEFRSETSASSLTLISEGRQEDVCGREVLIVDTPGLCNTDISEEKLEEEMKRALTLCKPGPDAFLLVMQLGRFTQQEKRVVETLQELIYKRVNEHTMVLFTYGDRLKKKTIEEFISTDTKLQQLLEKCGNRYHVFNNEDMDNRSQVSELLQKIGNMVATEMKTLDEGGRKYPINRAGTEMIPTPHRLPTGSAAGNQQSNELRIVLLGKTGAGKSVANSILGTKEFKPEASSSSLTSLHKKARREVDERELIVIDTTTNLMNPNTIQECISLSSPGPHVFLVLIQLGWSAQVEQDTVEVIRNFCAEAAKYTMVLFTDVNNLENKTIEEFLSCNKDLAEFTHNCRGRYHVFKSEENEVSRLLENIDRMVKLNGGGYYTEEMYLRSVNAIEEQKKWILKEQELVKQREEEDLMRRSEGEDLKRALQQLNEKFDKKERENKMRYNALLKSEKAKRENPCALQ